MTQRPERHKSGKIAAGDEELIRQLTERAQAEGLQLAGRDGLLGRLTKRVIEGALVGEMEAHLGYGKHDAAGRDGGNSRNGHRSKTVLTDAGPVGSRCRGIGTPPLNRSSWPSGSGG